MTAYQHNPHPHVARRKRQAAPKTIHEHLGLNGRIGLRITSIVGTMWAAYAFAALTLVSLPAAITSGSPIIIVAWLAQTFLQLVLLPVIIVGQNVQAQASDKRADQTYQDAEAILHECLELQRHLEVQDQILDDVVKHLPKPRARKVTA